MIKKKKVFINLGIAIGIMVGIVIYFTDLIPRINRRFFPPRYLASTEFEKKCSPYKNCIAVYLAPWCPTCKEDLPVINRLKFELDKNNPDLGIIAIVGKDTLKKCQEYSKQIIADVILDPDGELYEKLSIRYIPSWYKLSKKGRIITRHGGLLDTKAEEDFMAKNL
jgi:thiol-disulfide isomerase/thioredoxin